jgi:hypothetical protein
MKLIEDFNIVFLIITGAIIYYILGNKQNSKKPLYKGFNEDKFNLSQEWNSIYNDYNKSYNQLTNG